MRLSSKDQKKTQITDLNVKRNLLLTPPKLRNVMQKENSGSQYLMVKEKHHALNVRKDGQNQINKEEHVSQLNAQAHRIKSLMRTDITLILIEHANYAKTIQEFKNHKQAVRVIQNRNSSANQAEMIHAVRRKLL